MMYKSRKAAWVRALKSGKFPQTNGVLCRLGSEGKPEGFDEQGNKGGFCCLGVLCELAIADGAPIAVTEVGGIRTYDNEQGSLPYKVRQWAGLTESQANPVIDPGTPIEPCGACGQIHGDPSVNGLTAAAANDTKKFTFPEIAELIQKHM